MKRAVSVVLAALLILSVIPFTVFAAAAPVFSLNVTEESKDSVTVLVNLDSGEFKAVDIKVYGATDKIGACTYAMETDEFLDFIKDIKRSGGQGQSGANTDNGLFSASVTTAYNGSSVLEYKFKKNSDSKVASSDFKFEIKNCENSSGQVTASTVWNDISVTVSYNANGGTVSPASAKAEYGKTVTLPTPSKSGYTCLGWSSSASASSAAYACGASYTVNANITLYAVWKANSYTVSFNANGGSCSTSSKQVAYNSAYGTLPTPTRTGYTFNGWYTEANGGTKISADTKVTVTADQTLYAQWTINTYTVSFNANGGSVSPDSAKAEYGKTVTLPTPTRNEYNCLGWAESRTAKEAKFACGAVYTVNANSTLYAVWSKNLGIPVVTASNVASTGKVKLTWAAVDGAVSYNVYRATKRDGTYSLKKNTTSTSFINTASTAGKSYYYKVEAVAADGKTSGLSEVASRTCDLPRPEVKASNVASTGYVKLTWDAVTGAKSYKVYRSTSENGSYTLMKTTTSTSYINTSATAGTTYYYKVKAAASKSAADSAYSKVAAGTCKCAKPVIKASNDAATGKVKLSWDAVSGATAYNVYRSTSKNGTYSLIKTTSSAGYTDTTATAGKKYYYKVKAVAAKVDGDSAESKAVRRTCDLAKPVVSTGKSSSGKPKLTWDAVSGATSYRIYRSTSENGTFTLMKTTTSTSYTNTTANSGTTYYYRVKAICSNTDAYSAYTVVKVAA